MTQPPQPLPPQDPRQTPQDPRQTPLLERVRDRLAVARRSCKTERKRLERLVSRLQDDAREAEKAPVLREMGEVLKTRLRDVPTGADKVTLPVPWEPGRRLEIPLKPELDARQNLERIFRRARGFEQGLAVIAERKDAAELRMLEVEEAVQGLEAVLRRAEAWQQAHDREQPWPEKPGAILDAVDGALQAVKALRLKIGDEAKPLPVQRKIVKKGELPAGVQLFTSPQGRPVLAGRSAQANDAVVTRLMRGRDLWLHVQDQTGAHVVLRVEGNAPPEESEVQACAVLCAHLTGVPKGERVDVTCVQGKQVRKAKGAPAGTVYVSHGRTVRVTVEPAVVDAFYARRPPP